MPSPRFYSLFHSLIFLVRGGVRAIPQPERVLPPVSEIGKMIFQCSVREHRAFFKELFNHKI